MPVASADAPKLAMLFPSSSAPIKRSPIANRLDTTPASRLPCLESRSMLARDAPVSAVSLAEKKAEKNRQAMTIENVSQSMTCRSLHLSELFLQKITNQRWLDIGSNHGSAYGF